MDIFGNNEQRTVFKEVITRHLLGPGAKCDVFLCDEHHKEEVINQSAYDQYYTGILFPRRDAGNQVLANLEGDDVDPFASEHNLLNENEMGADADNVQEEDDDEQEEDDDAIGNQRDDFDPTWQEKYYPSFMGLIFCVENETQSVDVTFKYAKYHRMSEDEISQIKVILENPGQDYEVNKTRLNSLVEEFDKNKSYEALDAKIKDGLTLKDVLFFEDETKTIHLTQRLEKEVSNDDGARNVPLARKDIIKIYDSWKQSTGNDNAEFEYVKNKLLFLFDNIYHQRTDYEISIQIDVSEQDEDRSILRINEDIGYQRKVFTRESLDGTRRRIIKLILRNRNNWNDNWKSRSLFQVQVLVNSPNLKNYHDLIDNAIDEEHNTNEYLYRKESSFGQGVNCAVQWGGDDSSINWIKTSYLPEVFVKDFSNAINDDLVEIKETFKLRNISCWSTWDDQEIIKNLNCFVDKYEKWHETQCIKVSGEDNHQAIEPILEKQKRLVNRLRKNIDYINDNPNAFQCFKIANSAMYLQMLIARHPLFKKDRELSEFNEESFSDLNTLLQITFEDNPKLEPTYHPFQLAFLLMNVESTIVNEDDYRNEVDLIWFPTGGGKTEAYLALTALTIIARRRLEGVTGGVSVIMRYTLRLLTAQQFERATFLVCALEFLRTKADLGLGQDPISIGMWVGVSTTPNNTQELGSNSNKFGRFIQNINGLSGGNVVDKREFNNMRSKNPFPITYCPWCGCKIVTLNGDGTAILNGIYNNGRLQCMNGHCHFSGNESLPIYYVDDVIYEERPSVLFGTVDKFANLTNTNGHQLFNSKPTDDGLPPDLIIQDELHLINGPLGSMVGLFESMIELLATKNGRRPKVIASTATTRNTKHLVRQLYDRQVNIFPAQGITYDDNFFSRVDKGSKKRLHVGLIPTGHTSVMTEIYLSALLFLARIRLFMQFRNQTASEQITDDKGRLIAELDNYWSYVLFYNSLKDLGRTKSRIPQEIYDKLRALMSGFYHPSDLQYLYSRFFNRVSEFTSREDSGRIKSMLTKAESATALQGENNYVNGVDLIMASNMISVGIDIPRLNVMIFAGQPKSVSEYIQSSSRVARKHKGIVVNLLNPFRNREKSIFENYTAFHNVYYKYVEPLSATPYTAATIDRLASNLLVCYVRHKLGQRANTPINDDQMNELVQFLTDRCLSQRQKDYLRIKLESLRELWNSEVDEGHLVDYNYFNNPGKKEFKLMKSLRSIDPDCILRIQGRN